MKSSLFFLTSDARILDLIRKGDEEALVMLYESNRRPVSEYVLHNHGTVDDAEDMLQEALVILWERVGSGRFEAKAKLGTFLYGTVKNLWFVRLRRRGKEQPGGLDPNYHPDSADSVLDGLIASEEAEMVKKALQRIGEQCRKMLLLFYWEELSMEEIAGQLGFANANTAKAKKYQCKKELERILKTLQ